MLFYGVSAVSKSNNKRQQSITNESKCLKTGSEKKRILTLQHLFFENQKQLNYISMEHKNVKRNENHGNVLMVNEGDVVPADKTMKHDYDMPNDELLFKTVENLLMNESSVVLLRGNAGRDAEAVPNTDGKMAKFSLAVNHFKFNQNGGYRPIGDDGKETDWYNVEVRRDQVSRTMDEVKKGCKLTMIGKLRKVKYTNKAGQQVNDTKVILTNFWAEAA